MKVKICGLFIFFLFAGCMEAEKVERSRIASPDGAYEAVLVESLSSALGESSLGVIISVKGEPLPEKYSPVFVSSSIDPSGVTWTNSRQVNLSYKKNACIYSFRNRWNPLKPDVKKPLDTIEITLQREN